jgi:hypothetical protein
MNSELGNFIFHIFKDTDNFKELKPQTAARLMYLSTYLGYKDNQLMITERKPMVKKDLKEVMQLKRSTFNGFYKEIIDGGYLLPIEGGLYLSTKHFDRGKLSKLLSPNKNYRFTKVFIEATRKLYLSTEQNMHNCLGYIFKLIPYVNLQWNILCHNPLEQDKKHIEPMTVGELCNKIGYDVSKAGRLLQTFSKVLFEWNGEQQKFCSFVYENEKTNMRIFVNPNIFYAGSNWKEVSFLGIFFDDEKKKAN